MIPKAFAIQQLFAPLSWFTAILEGVWPSLIKKGWRAVNQLLGRREPEGMYEILDYELTLELKDARGEEALVTRRQQVRFLQDNIIAYQDQAWGEGNPLTDYRCHPGVPVDFYREGLKHHILISLRERKQKGDVVEFNIERKVTGGFTNSEEWFQAEPLHKTRRLKIRIIFPKERHCQRAVLIERTRNRTIVLDDSHFSLLADGRQVLTWETTNVPRTELYTIKWRW